MGRYLVRPFFGHSLLCLPWFRVHIVVLNDPGRLLSVHLIHTGLISGWAGIMILYELLVSSCDDPTFNPLWRQSCYVVPPGTRLSVVESSIGDTASVIAGLSVGRSLTAVWNYSLVSTSHFCLSGLVILAAT